MAKTKTQYGTPEINQNVRSDRENKNVQAALKVMNRNLDVKIMRDNRNLLIQQLFDRGFEVADPTGTRKLSPQILQQAMWRTVNKMKPLDFEIHGTYRPENVERIVTDAVGTVMDKGGYISSLRDKDGAFMKLMMYGDAMIQIGTDPDGDAKYPICFTPISNSNIYIDSFATSMRTGLYGRRVTKMVVIFSYSWDEFCDMYPEMKRKAGIGKIPRDSGLMKELERDYFQTFKLSDDLIEVAHYYDISNKVYTCFAGTACTVIKEYKGDQYPYEMDGEPYIPVLHFMCMPSADGFWNYGIGHILYKMALIQSRLMNMAIGHVEDNTYPITMVNVPQAEAGKFFRKLQQAHEMRATGKKGYMAMEYDPSTGAYPVSANSLTTNALFNEWQVLFERLDQEIRRLGINLDDIDRNTDVTATQIMSEEENSNAFVKQVQEYNASETKFAVEVTMDFIKKFISTKDDSALNLTTKISLNDGTEREINKMQPEVQPTMGDVAEELREHNYFVIVNSRSGAIPSNMMEQAQVTRLLQSTQPGTPAYEQLMEEMATLNGKDLPKGSFGVPMQPQVGNPPSQGSTETGSLPMSETDRMVINPRSGQQIPAF